MNTDLKELKRRRAVLERRMVIRTRRAYENLLHTAGGNTEMPLYFLRWHLVAYRNYLDALEVDEECARNDEYAESIRMMLHNPAFLMELPSLPFWTPSIVSEVK